MLFFHIKLYSYASLFFFSFLFFLIEVFIYILPHETYKHTLFNHTQKTHTLSQLKVKAMRHYEVQCAKFLQEVTMVLRLLDTIEEQHRTVWTKTSSLNATCERLLSEQQV